MKTYVHAAGGLVTAIALAGLLAPGALAANSHCPSGGTPSPGSVVNGGLEVDGDCSLSNVLVNGDIVVDKNAGLGFVDSTANGGIIVASGGELDINHTLAGIGGNNQIGTKGTVNGEIVMTNPVDFDLLSARLNGGLQVNGAATGSAPSMCGLNINGGVAISNVTSSGVFLGDPEDRPTFENYLCPGNTVNGNVTFSHVNSGAIEGNTINGSVTVSASSIEFNGNTITGQSTCTTGSTIVPGEPPDPASNTCAQAAIPSTESQRTIPASPSTGQGPLIDSAPKAISQSRRSANAKKHRRHSKKHRGAVMSRHTRPPATRS